MQTMLSQTLEFESIQYEAYSEQYYELKIFSASASYSKGIFKICLLVNLSDFRIAL